MINWDSMIQSEWDESLRKYNDYLTNPVVASRDARVTITNAAIVAKMSEQEFYNFLFNEFFPWKYTAKNRLATTRRSLSKMSLGDLENIKNLLTSPLLSDEQLFDAAISIKGLGSAGATALLSVLYPDRFGTVDQFVVRCLQAAPSLVRNQVIIGTNPNSIKRSEAIYINRLLQEKSRDLNLHFGTYTWYPRTIDKAVWADR